jgi:hypothetical protein
MHSKDNTVFSWINDLVGTGTKFSLNVIISMAGGVVYSFGIWPSPAMLTIFGVVSPLIFTLCLYCLIRQLKDLPENPFPKLFASEYGNTTLMVFDMIIIVALASLIYFNIINYLFFRILQTIFFPIIMLSMLRILFLMVKFGNENEEN